MLSGQRSIIKHGTTSIFPTLSSSGPHDSTSWNLYQVDGREKQPYPGTAPRRSLPEHENGRRTIRKTLKILIRIDPFRSYLTGGWYYQALGCCSGTSGSHAIPVNIIAAKGILPSVAHTQANLKISVQLMKPDTLMQPTSIMQCPATNAEYKYEGTVENIYLLDDMTVEVVADGIHVPYDPETRI